MLPRTMSQGNDALVPKDAESAANAEPAPDRSSDGSRSDKSADAKKSGAIAPASESSESDERAQRRSASPKRHRDQATDDADDEARADDDDDDDADQRDDDSDQRDSDPDAGTRKARPKQDRDAEGRSSVEARARKSRRGGQRRSRDEDDEERLVPPETEEAVNVPKMETVYMLGAMSVLTVILWFAARLTCNVHPDQVRDPKHFSTKDLAADPKNAAFEFQQRFETGDYVTSYDLATGELRRIVEGKLKECEQAADDCAANQKKLAGSVESTPRVLEQSPTRANVEIQSYFHGSSTPKTFAFDVAKEGDFWRVASRREVANAPLQQVSPAAANPAAAIPGVNAAAPNPGVANPAALTPGAANAAEPAAPVELPEQPAQQQ